MPDQDDSGFSELAWLNGAGTTLEQQDYAYKVSTLEPGGYTFRLKQIDLDGNFEYLGPLEVTVEVPGSYLLSNAYPNPFSGKATFTLAVPRAQHVQVVLYDVMARPVLRLFEGSFPAKETVEFTVDGTGLPSGVYFYHVEGESFSQTKELVVGK